VSNAVSLLGFRFQLNVRLVLATLRVCSFLTGLNVGLRGHRPVHSSFLLCSFIIFKKHFCLHFDVLKLLHYLTRERYFYALALLRVLLPLNQFEELLLLLLVDLFMHIQLPLFFSNFRGFEAHVRVWHWIVAQRDCQRSGGWCSTVFVWSCKGSSFTGDSAQVGVDHPALG